MRLRFLPVSGLCAATADTAAATFHHCAAQCEESESDADAPTITDLYRKSLAPYVSSRSALATQWIKDEEGWTKLPARAWPSYQADVEDIPSIETLLSTTCPQSGELSSAWTTECSTIKFNLATALVFNNVDHGKGLQMYKELATRKGHADSKCAVGVILVEGLGTDANEKDGLRYLRDAVENDRHPQAMYELGTALYCGLENILEENEEEAFKQFAAASEQGHYAGMYMTSDCLLEGIGCSVDVERAMPLLFDAAISGHRFARQKVRELFTKYVDA